MATLAITLSSLTLGVGQTQQLEAVPAGDDVAWQSTDPAIATVTGAGLVTGVAAGTAEILVRRGSAPNFATIRLPITVPAGDVAPIEPPIEPPPPRTVLTPADLTYLGVVRVPLDASTNNPDGGIRFGYSNGQGISGRYVDGVLHLFMTMSQAYPWRGPVIELVYDKTPDPVKTSAGRLSTYKVWGAIQELTVKDSNGARIHALHWDEDLQALFYTFDAYYSVEQNRTIGAVTFTGTTSYTRYGPWRTTSNKRQTNGPIVTIPPDARASFGGHAKLSVGCANSINAINTWGHSLYSWDATNILSVPESDFTNEKEYGIETTGRMQADYTTRMQRAATYKTCTYANANYNCADGVTLSGPQSTCSQLDTANGAVWIDTSTKHGIVFMSMMVDVVDDAAFVAAKYGGDTHPHVFYSTYKNCCHGQDKGVNSGTGPHTPSLVPQFWIYDPATAIAGATGAITPYQAANTPSTSHKHLYDYHANFKKDSGYYAAGLFFDPVSRLLFMPDTFQDSGSQHEAIPVIHVFQVAD